MSACQIVRFFHIYIYVCILGPARFPVAPHVITGSIRPQLLPVNYIRKSSLELDRENMRI